MVWCGVYARQATAIAVTSAVLDGYQASRQRERDGHRIRAAGRCLGVAREEMRRGGGVRAEHGHTGRGRDGEGLPQVRVGEMERGKNAGGAMTPPRDDGGDHARAERQAYPPKRAAQVPHMTRAHHTRVCIYMCYLSAYAAAHRQH